MSRKKSQGPDGAERQQQNAADGLRLREFILIPREALEPFAKSGEEWERILNQITSCHRRELVSVESPSDGFAAVSALRILQAVSVALQRSDASTLATWERKTLAYMKKHDLEGYVRFALQPRTNVDRHLVVGSLLKRVTALIHVHKTRSLPPEHVAQLVIGWIVTAIPSLLNPEILLAAVDQVAHRFRALLQSPKIDPEMVLLDGLGALGVERIDGHNWLKGARR